MPNMDKRSYFGGFTLFRAFSEEPKCRTRIPVMKSPNQLCHLLFALVVSIFFTTILSDTPPSMYPSKCSDKIPTCESYLYHISSGGLTNEEIATAYAVDASQLKPISHGDEQDYLVPVSCNCTDVDGVKGYFYETVYKANSTTKCSDVNNKVYGGQALEGAEDMVLEADDSMPFHLLCGCAEKDSQVIVTYTVQEHDSLSEIANQLSANMTAIQEMNDKLVKDPNSIFVGWVLFVPMEKNETQPQSQEAPIQAKSSGEPPVEGIVANVEAYIQKGHRLPVIIAAASAVAALCTCTLIMFLLARKKGTRIPGKDQENDSDPIPELQRKISRKDSFMQYKMLHAQYTEDVESFESDQKGTYSVEEINEATNNFDESMKVGEGGYGGVYLGTLKEREVAIKQMKSSNTKEFFAELKVLYRVHHINVVELLGYASGDDHLYLVYEYLQNGSVSDHLHGFLLKGHPPLSWTARLSIALDAARGIEYIHDYTKDCYVHRDIKTSNILLDLSLRAKIADFGLAKLIERTNDQDNIATCLVGTPGYIAPESVRELQMTSKSDVFAFGVVLAELITGQPALIRNSEEPNRILPLITVMRNIFKDEDREGALEAIIDSNLGGSYPVEQVHKMADISERCLSDDPAERPNMRGVVQMLTQILTTSVEWEASAPEESSSEDWSWLLKKT